MATGSEDPTNKVKIPYLKNKTGGYSSAGFTDVMEFDKFARGKKLLQPRFHLQTARSHIVQAKVFVINPMGFNLILTEYSLERFLRSLRLQHRLRVPAEAAAAQETKASEVK